VTRRIRRHRNEMLPQLCELSIAVPKKVFSVLTPHSMQGF
jgi:hypothetical protein